ncbi:universal stress protein [Blastococcus sp. PRF04-17]|uniref:universal stress protein n=1 Tax=Blastococcus sp. PRF04-17 TaxID=2933797 RepID=UPI001FF3D171|nr:universal stress protein [Blastococcus sp. PRF04-17]UOY03143.1 universal stress protein [Blastococcus sp. PRF04-17]
MTQQAEPVVVVDDQREDRGPRVVAGIDFSPGARAALLFALEDAARRGSRWRR